ncbi:MAG: TetR/AcrR family transcriptional regulator [Bacteroidia bacterium]
MSKDDNTEKRILTAARKIFYEKGLAGARMEEIAQEAGINKAMLHYYFRSKQKLFEKIFQEAFAQIFPRLLAIIMSDESLEEKIKQISYMYNDMLSENPLLPLFVLSSIQRDADSFIQSVFLDAPIQPAEVMAKLMAQIQAEVAAGKIKPVDPRDLIINLIAMSVFPFMMKPVLTRLFGLSEQSFLSFIQKRKDTVSEFAYRAISSSESLPGQ